MNAITKIIREYPGTSGITFVYFMFTNIYLIESDAGLIVVDTGLAGNTWKIIRAIKKLGYQPHDLSTIILTHAHLDHFGCAAPLKNKTGARVVAHHLDVEFFEKGGVGVMPRILPDEPKLNTFFRGKFLGAPPVKIDKALHDGDRIGEWVIIHTPGHTPGTINLYSETRKLLIAGGWAIPGKANSDNSRYRNPFVGYISSDPSQLQSSRLRLAKLDFDTLLCSHFPPRLFPTLKRQLLKLK